MNLVFEDPAYFRFLDYQLSHTQLLIRGENVLEGDNIDFVFEGTVFVNCPTHFYGIRIYQLDEVSSKERLITEFAFTRNFLISSQDVEYFIQAGVLRIYRNALNFSQSSIDMTGRGQENLLWMSK
jgi:hypothetical protein